MPKTQQIRNQVLKFKGLTQISSKAYPCMDAFKEMIEIERQFGAIHLGHEPEASSKLEAKPQRKANSIQPKLAEIEIEVDEDKPSLWTHLATSCLNETPKKFRHFLELIGKATIEKYSILEMQRRKIFQEFLKQKNEKRAKQQIQQLQKMAKQDHDYPDLQLNDMILQHEKNSDRLFWQEVK